MCPQCPALHRRTSHWRSSTRGWVLIQQHSITINYAAKHKRWMSFDMDSNECEVFSWNLSLDFSSVWLGWTLMCYKESSAGVHSLFIHIISKCVYLYQSSSYKPTLEQSNTHYFHSWDDSATHADLMRVGRWCERSGSVWTVKDWTEFTGFTKLSASGSYHAFIHSINL